MYICNSKIVLQLLLTKVMVIFAVSLCGNIQHVLIELLILQLVEIYKISEEFSHSVLAIAISKIDSVFPNLL